MKSRQINKKTNNQTLIKRLKSKNLSHEMLQSQLTIHAMFVSRGFLLSINSS